MKLVAFSAVIIAMTAAPAFAQTAPASAPAPATTPAADAAAAGKFTIDTPIATIVADPAGKAVLDADFPGMTTHPAYEQFKVLSLAAVQPLSNGMITDAQLAKAKADLAAIK
jgi:hypothetical protein